MRDIGLAWTIGSEYGWGTYGFQIASNLASGRLWQPVLLREPSTIECNPLERLTLDRTFRYSEIQRNKLAPFADQAFFNLSMPLLHAMGNGGKQAFSAEKPNLIGPWNAALTFLENTRLDLSEVERFNRFDAVIAGSTWVRDVLRESGVTKAKTCLQGIDPATFHPAPKRNAMPDRFLIFSGGKFEYRKAQDAVVAAFKIFRQRHHDAILIAVWGNRWPEASSVRMFRNSRLIDGAPPLATKNLIDWPAFLRREGIEEDAVAVFESVRHLQLAHLIRECDVALFPNRAEGGTNLVAMEAMACGIPTILSANTGHLDIIADDNCLPLTRQPPTPSPEPGFGCEGWGEPDVEEIVEALEFVYRNRQRAADLAKAGEESMRALTWRRQIAALMTACGL